jgi:hypothetical protein
LFKGTANECYYLIPQLTKKISVVTLLLNLLRRDFRDCRIRPISASIPGFPDEKNEGRDQANRDKHPVLAVET